MQGGRASPGETFARNKKRAPEEKSEDHSSENQLIVLGEVWVHFVHACMHAKLPHSCLTLCHPVDYILPGYSVRGILQARILEWVAVPSSRGSSGPGIKPTSLSSPALGGGFFTTSACHLGSSLPHLVHTFAHGTGLPTQHGAVMSSDNRLQTVVLAGS